MKKLLESEIIINGEPDDVWKTLMDFNNYDNWNPFIKSISGKKKEGEQLNVIIKPPGGKRMKFKPTILVIREKYEFRWIGKFIIKGLLDGEHYFKLEKIRNNQTKFIHGEKFQGLLVRIMRSALNNTNKGFVLMNQALKNEIEKNKQ